MGDRIIYPNQGLGVIEKIQEENIFGENFEIYHVRILANNTLVLVPSANTAEIGIRKPIPLDSIKEIFQYLKESPVDVISDWKGRYKEHINLMQSGELFDTASVLKSLYFLSLTKPLSFREKKMLEKAKELVVSEISAVSSLPLSQTEQKIIDALTLCFKDLNPNAEF